MSDIANWVFHVELFVKSGDSGAKYQDWTELVQDILSEKGLKLLMAQGEEEKLESCHKNSVMNEVRLTGNDDLE